ncbi:MAG TPA: tripartite tricarboxylate transporter substrate-binding protein, partial [Hyphomicrobiaceae bacterium]|nr:tripartite tricarboxylate transporter substrate-binding protein [Hyphomicrobiaceae bacterium]
MARALGAGLRPVLRHPVVIENVAGAGGTIGMDRAAKAKADGYTLVVTSTGSVALGPQMGVGDPDHFRS